MLRYVLAKRATLTLIQRQFHRLLEMLLLKELDQKDVQKVKAYRLQVKARLYRFNYVSNISEHV